MQGTKEEPVVTEIREDGVVGLYASPAGTGPFPSVVAFAGSSGGLGPTVGWAPALASAGFAVLAIAYFGGEGLPQALVNIEVEVVERGVRWLRDNGQTDGDVAVMGVSRGSELALLASVLLDGVGPVVAFAPSGIHWSGLGPMGPVNAPAWTFRGDAVPFAAMGAPPPELAQPPAPDGPPLALRPIFDAALDEPAVWQDAEIAVERAKGPVLLVSGEDDAMWPSTRMAGMIERRATERGAAHSVVHLHYPDAGHASGGVPGFPAETQVLHPLTGGFYALGGTLEGNQAARSHSWPQVLTFLADALHAPGQES